MVAFLKCNTFCHTFWDTKRLDYLLYRSKTYYFNRRIPAFAREFDSRKFVRFSLKTDSESQARKLAVVENEKLEKYWAGLIATGKKHSHDHYENVVERASLLGFQYISSAQLAESPINELINRIAYLEQQQLNPTQIEAVLGGVPVPIVKLDDALAKFWELNNDIVLTKEPQQIKKWKNPRRLAMRNLIACIGNKSLKDLTREDLIKFRDWWISRIEKENLTTSVARKNFIQSKAIIGAVSDHYKLGIDTQHLYHNLILDYEYESRKPFSTEYINNVLLSPVNLKGMKDAYQCLLYVLSETGISFAEQIGILPEDIFLEGPIPYVDILPRPKRKLKTKYRRRSIPLVGYSLEVFKKYPTGLSHIVDNADSASAAINKFLRENNLFPSEKHSVYSLRHSFQDRLLRLNCPDRIQADLMGHKFNREAYGEGATLEHKLEWLKLISLVP